MIFSSHRPYYFSLSVCTKTNYKVSYKLNLESANVNFCKGGLGRIKTEHLVLFFKKRL